MAVMAGALVQLNNFPSSVACGRISPMKGNKKGTFKMMSSIQIPPLRLRSFSGLQGSNALNTFVESVQTFHSKVAAVSSISQGMDNRITPKAGSENLKEQKWTQIGLITESLPNGMFRVRLDNQNLILGYISGKMRKNFIRILPGDKVKIEVSRYDSTRGRIIYRIKDGKN